MGDSNKQYSEDEVKKIIERALALQKKNQAALPSGEKEGVTLDEIDTIAGEVGISSELIRQAAFELEAGRESKGKNWFLGGELSPEASASAKRTATQRELERVL